MFVYEHKSMPSEFQRFFDDLSFEDDTQKKTESHRNSTKPPPPPLPKQKTKIKQKKRHATQTTCWKMTGTNKKRDHTDQKNAMKNVIKHETTYKKKRQMET